MNIHKRVKECRDEFFKRFPDPKSPERRVWKEFIAHRRNSLDEGRQMSEQVVANLQNLLDREGF